MGAIAPAWMRAPGIQLPCSPPRTLLKELDGICVWEMEIATELGDLLQPRWAQGAGKVSDNMGLLDGAQEEV